jgi:excisionase family DNA binding protein
LTHQLFPAYFFIFPSIRVALEVISMRLLTAKQVSEILQVTLPRVYSLARQRQIPSIRLGRQVRFPEEKLTQWVEEGGADLERRETPELRGAA